MRKKPKRIGNQNGKVINKNTIAANSRMKAKSPLLRI